MFLLMLKAETDRRFKKYMVNDAKSKEGKKQRVKFEKVFAEHFLSVV
jgi:tetrapyrrole methylase family protein/MazG family protein